MVTRSIFPETELPRTHLSSARERKILAACLHIPQKVAREVSLRSRAVTKKECTKTCDTQAELLVVKSVDFWTLMTPSTS